MNSRREHRVSKVKSKKKPDDGDDKDKDDESKNGLVKLVNDTNSSGNSFRNVIKQDINGIRVVLLRLQGLLQNFESSVPLEKEFSSIPVKINTICETTSSTTSTTTPTHTTTNKLIYHKNDFGKKELDLMQENTDLKRQVMQLEQQLEEKNRTIKLLQQQSMVNKRPETSGRRNYGHKKQFH